MDIEGSLGFIIGSVNTKMKNNLAKALKPYNVTTEQWALLIRLWRRDGVTQKELSERSLKDQPTTARILDKLEKRALVYRRANPEDRRAFQVFLTEEGRNLRTALTASAQHSLEESLQGLTEDERVQLKKLLNKIIATVN